MAPGIVVLAAVVLFATSATMLSWSKRLEQIANGGFVLFVIAVGYAGYGLAQQWWGAPIGVILAGGLVGRLYEHFRGSARRTKQLEGQLEDPNIGVRLGAVQTANVDIIDGVRLLARGLSNSDDSVRSVAAERLAVHRHADVAYAALVPALGDANEGVRARARASFEKLGGELRPKWSGVMAKLRSKVRNPGRYPIEVAELALVTITAPRLPLELRFSTACCLCNVYPASQKAVAKFGTEGLTGDPSLFGRARAPSPLAPPPGSGSSVSIEVPLCNLCFEEETLVAPGMQITRCERIGGLMSSQVMLTLGFVNEDAAFEFRNINGLWTPGISANTA